MCACTCVVTQHMSSNTQNKPSQADQGIGRKEGSGKKSRNGDGKYSTISVKNIICNSSKEIKDFTKKQSPNSLEIIILKLFDKYMLYCQLFPWWACSSLWLYQVLKITNRTWMNLFSFSSSTKISFPDWFDECSPFSYFIIQFVVLINKKYKPCIVWKLTLQNLQTKV